MREKILAFILLCFTHGLCGQTGAWLPSSADLSHPRTILDITEIDSVRAHLANEPNFEVFKSLSGFAFATLPPASSTTPGDRRARGEVAKNAAFMVLMGQKAGATFPEPLSVADSVFLAERAIDLLNQMNTSVPAYPTTGDWQYLSEGLLCYLEAYDLLKGAGVDDVLLDTARINLREFTSNFYREATLEVFGIGFMTLNTNNHVLRTIAPVGVAAIVLNEHGGTSAEESPENWINAAMWNIDNIYWEHANKQSDDSGIYGYAEGTHYFKYGTKHVLSLMHAFGNVLSDTTISYLYKGNTRSIRHPFYDTRYEKLLQWHRAIAKPDGRMPSIDDSYQDNAFPELAILDKAEYVIPLNFDHALPGQTNSLAGYLRKSTDDYRADFLCSFTTFSSQEIPHFQPLPDAGNLAFRSSWDEDATYLLMMGESGIAHNSGQGHNQADVTSFSLMHKGRTLVWDAGYLKWDRRNEVSNAENHNMILVDGLGPLTGSISDARGAAGYIEDYFDLAGLDYGEVRTAYYGAEITRKVFFIREDYFVINDFVSAASAHTYQWQLHGNGKIGSPADAGRLETDFGSFSGTYIKDSVKLQVVVIARDTAASYATTVDKHEVTYNKDSLHHTMRVDAKTGNTTEFAACLIPYTSEMFEAESIVDGAVSGFVVSKDGFEDLNLIQENTTSRNYTAGSLPVSYALAFDGMQNFFSQDTLGDFSQFYVENGTELVIGGVQWLSATSQVDVAFEKINPDSFAGYINTAGTVELYCDGAAMMYAAGGSLSSQSYDGGTHTITLSFSGAGYFWLSDVPITNLAEPEVQENDMIVWPNPGRGVLNVQLDKGIQSLAIRDLSGRQVFFGNIREKVIQINVSDLPRGIYLLQASGYDGREYVRKWLKQ